MADGECDSPCGLGVGMGVGVESGSGVGSGSGCRSGSGSGLESGLVVVENETQFWEELHAIVSPGLAAGKTAAAAKKTAAAAAAAAVSPAASDGDAGNGNDTPETSPTSTATSTATTTTTTTTTNTSSLASLTSVSSMEEVGEVEKGGREAEEEEEAGNGDGDGEEKEKGDGDEEEKEKEEENHEQIDDALRRFLEFTSRHQKAYIRTEYDIARCCWKLLDAELFKKNADYVRRQMLYCLLQEEEAETLHLVAAVLLFDGRANEATFELMQAEGTFQRLVELVGREKKRDEDENENGGVDVDLQRLLLELLFEMSRIQKLSREDLKVVDDAFILYLFQMIEELSSDAQDPYHYPIIRVLLVLNEQYMCLANTPASPGSGTEQGMTNRILKLLSLHGPSYRTFGENLILLLNRETELGPQLLILKLLYLLFTTPSTYEYFYTNDLNVLVDVIIRNLLDLDESHDSDLAPDRDGQRALRHTYLRVLCPLLKNTQLAHEGQNYKRDGVRRLLYLLIDRTSAHFAPVDETVIRLVTRIKQIEWIREEGDEMNEAIEEKLGAAPSGVTHACPARNGGDEVVAKKLLGMSLPEAGESSLSVSATDVTAKVVKAKPSVPVPRRMRKTSRVAPNGTSTQGAIVKDGHEEKLLEVPAKEGPKTRMETEGETTTQAAMFEPEVKKRPKLPPAPPKSKYGRRMTGDKLKPVAVEVPIRSDSRSPFADENAAT